MAAQHLYEGLIAAGAAHAPGLLLSSPAQRCTALAHAVSAALPHWRLVIEPALHEMDFGAWEGMAWDSVPRQELDAWAADFATYAPGGGESVQQVLQRVAAALAQTMEMVQSDVPVVWVSHAGVMRAVRYLQRNPLALPKAADWPQESPAMGEWLVMA